MFTAAATEKVAQLAEQLGIAESFVTQLQDDVRFGVRATRRRPSSRTRHYSDAARARPVRAVVSSLRRARGKRP